MSGRPARTGVCAVACAAVFVAAAGCTGGDDTAPTSPSSPVTTPAPAPDATALQQTPELTSAYFDAVASGGSVTETLAVPGGNADLYATFRRDAARLLGEDVAAVTVTSTPNGVEMCGSTCSSYSSLVVEPATGRIDTFAIDGLALDGRVVGDGLRADDDGIVGRITSAFRNQAGDVLTVVEVDNTTDAEAELFGFAAVYQPAGDDRSREATGWWGPPTVAAGTTGQVLVAFAAPQGAGRPGRPLGGGRVSLSGLRGDGVDIALDLAIPRAVG